MLSAFFSLLSSLCALHQPGNGGPCKIHDTRRIHADYDHGEDRDRERYRKRRRGRQLESTVRAHARAAEEDLVHQLGDKRFRALRETLEVIAGLHDATGVSQQGR